MKPKMILKISVDVVMTIALLLLMAYSLIGEAAHEWIGIGMFVLFVLHHILNRKWSMNVLKGKYTAVRVWQTVLVIAVLLCMTGSMVSGVILSRHALDFLPARTGQGWARTLHLLCAYWGLVMMSLHIGFHFSMMMAMAAKHIKSVSAGHKGLSGIAAVAISVYGIYAFINRRIGSYMFLKNEFVFFDFDEPIVFFFIDYIAIMLLFVFIGHFFTEFLKWYGRKQKRV